jgi:hypothetical protein
MPCGWKRYLGRRRGTFYWKQANGMEDIVTWRKATASASNGDCVEVGTTDSGHAAGIRDSKSPERGHLAVTAEVFAAYLADVKAGNRDM